VSKDAPKGRQIWLTTQEIELARDAIDFWCAQLNSGYPSDAHKAAGRYVFRHAQALRKRLQSILDELTPPKVANTGDKTE
jgi:hypothetical protein